MVSFAGIIALAISSCFTVGGILCLLGFWKRRSLPILHHRSPSLSLISGLSSLALLILLSLVILLGDDKFPSLISLSLGLVLSSLSFRPYILRTLLFSLRLHSLSPSPSLSPSLPLRGKNSEVTSSLESGLSSSLANIAHLSSPENHQKGKEPSSSKITRLLPWISLGISLLLDLIFALICLGNHPELGLSFSSSSSLTLFAGSKGYPILLDWYLFFTLNSLLLLLLISLAFKYGMAPESFGIMLELVSCSALMFFFSLGYSLTFYDPFESWLPFPEARYFILMTLLLLLFLLSIMVPWGRSFWEDIFEEPGYALEEEGDPKSSGEPMNPIKLCAILENDGTASSFQVFLAKEFSAENLFFYRMVEKYRRPNEKITPEMRLGWAIKIANQYMRPGAKAEINVLKVTQDEIWAKIEAKEADLDLFNKAAKEIWLLMEKDCLPRFLKKSGVYGGRKESFLNPRSSSEVATVIITPNH